MFGSTVRESVVIVFILEKIVSLSLIIIELLPNHLRLVLKMKTFGRVLWIL